MARPLKTLFYADSLSGSLPLYSIAHVLFRLVGFARMILFTWLLGEVPFGVLSMGLVFINFTASLVLLGTPSALERYIPLYQNTHNLKAFLKRILPLCLLICVVGTFILALNIGPVSAVVFSLTRTDSATPSQVEQFSQLTVACIAAVFVFSCFSMIISCLKGLRFFRAVAAMELSHALFFTGLAAALVLGYLNKPVVVIIAQVISMAAMCLVFGLLLIINLHTTSDQSESLAKTGYLSRFARYAIWGLPNTLTWLLMMAFPLWYLYRRVGPGTTGVYWAYFTLVNSIFFLSVPFWSVMNIHAVRGWVQSLFEQTRSTVEVSFRAFSLLLLTICMIFTLAAPLLRHIFSSDFAMGAQYVHLLCLPVLLAANFGLVHLLTHMLERPSLRVLALTFGNVVLFIAGFYLIPRYGITGAALSGALGLAVATCLGLLMLGSRKCSLSVPTWLVLFCPALLLIANLYILLASYVVLILIAIFSPVFFSADQKRYVLDSCKDALARYLPKRFVS